MLQMPLFVSFGGCCLCCILLFSLWAFYFKEMDGDLYGFRRFWNLPGSKVRSLCKVARQADRALKGKRLHVGTYDLQSIPGMQYDRIYTNFSFPGAFVLQFETLGLCAYENCSLILIDEIMMYADSRDFKSFTPELKHFFSQHRKMHCDVHLGVTDV